MCACMCCCVQECDEGGCVVGGVLCCRVVCGAAVFPGVSEQDHIVSITGMLGYEFLFYFFFLSFFFFLKSMGVRVCAFVSFL
jgi:hypothetical protein